MENENGPHGESLRPSGLSDDGSHPLLSSSSSSVSCSGNNTTLHSLEEFSFDETEEDSVNSLDEFIVSDDEEIVVETKEAMAASSGRDPISTTTAASYSHRSGRCAVNVGGSGSNRSMGRNTICEIDKSNIICSGTTRLRKQPDRYITDDPLMYQQLLFGDVDIDEYLNTEAQDERYLKRRKVDTKKQRGDRGGEQKAKKGTETFLTATAAQTPTRLQGLVPTSTNETATPTALAPGLSPQPIINHNPRNQKDSNSSGQEEHEDEEDTSYVDEGSDPFENNSNNSQTNSAYASRHTSSDEEWESEQDHSS